ncbi:tRNA (guanosine(37)-N1)-methyltransferase TrmD [Neomicrococcus aestuarii]|uniref:tRNA (guanine-N(1)-)-methyltransferase n=1 Tax=Neomicrococcus aestuarii TaxID=556325 RepID=A0A1L2ZL80_9MICC|nr:tRNA (guanosine(37)-N1)-methyltransferase TrmD [Neomicrococcus aestuarii]APF39960.1 tRNA (guanosine(37)-N1)-methyltransferase TrmD [Neomicrococcus aestuarii]
MRIDAITIFPEIFNVLDVSLLGKAREAGLLNFTAHNLRDFTTDVHRTVDDSPYGGGAGMVMKPEPWALALESVLPGEATDTADEDPSLPLLIIPTPSGHVFNQQLARALSHEKQLVFACGRYEGIDERVYEWASDKFRVLPVSLGDYVLNGGEVAVLAMIEAIGRLIPGVVGNPESLVEESHEDGLLEYPVYTKPSTWRDLEVPEVLLSGNHGKIARFRREAQLTRTAQRRPELILDIDPATTNRKDRDLLWHAGYMIEGDRFVPKPESMAE